MRNFVWWFMGQKRGQNFIKTTPFVCSLGLNALELSEIWVEVGFF